MNPPSQPEALTGCADKHCPSRMQCARYAARHASGYADFNRDDGKQKCEDGFIEKASHD